MQDEMIQFELATHFLPKVSLNLESQIQTIMESFSESHPIIHQNALFSCNNVLTIIEKPGLKSRFLKEFLRVEHLLTRKKAKISDPLYDLLFQQLQYLSNLNSNFASSLNDDLFLRTIRNNLTTSNQVIHDFLPQLQFWIEADPIVRKEMIGKWIDALSPLYKTVHTYLSILRQTALYSIIKLDRGFYQQALPPSNHCQLIAVRLSKLYDSIPKINLGKFGLSIRLFEVETMLESQKEHTEIELAFCQL